MILPAEHEANVFGQFDTYAKKLERTFHVTLIARDGSTKIVGETEARPGESTARNDTASRIVQKGQYNHCSRM